MQQQKQIERAVRAALGDIGGFSRGLIAGHLLRTYQLIPARAIIDSVINGKGLSFAVVFSRQAGKDEMLAQLIAYLLNIYQVKGGSIVVAAPTYKPQCLISRRRLEERLDNPLSRNKARGRGGYIVDLGKASAKFLSTDPSANVRGETASLLLLCNEAQDVIPERWDAAFDPMGASTNATTVFCGTVWTSRTLLARQMRYLRQREIEDGIKRVYLVDWKRVALDVPAYGERVKERIRQLGENHPFVRTEYMLEEIDGEGGLFPPDRRTLMHANHPARTSPEPGKTYAFLLDVAGEEEETGGLETKSDTRDSTALTIVEADLSTVSDPVLLKPTYRVVYRRTWIGTRHTALYGEITALARDIWRPRFVIVDATGVGAGLASFLQKSLGERVVHPFVFNAVSKSDLGWNFISICDTGRFKDHTPDGSLEQRIFWRQVEECEFEVRPGPGKLMKWAVADPKVHDDLLVSAAMCGVLDEVDWKPRMASGRVR